MQNNIKYRFIDLFSGTGGMSFGFKNHPAFTPVFAVDAQVGKPSSGKGVLECNGAYEANIGIRVREADLTEYRPQQLMEESGLKPGQLDVLISCAPCTGFSRMNGRNHMDDDARNRLVERTGDFVEALRPSILVMENARELIKGNFTYHCRNLAEHLERLGYSFYAKVHMLSNYGLPQIRERALVMAVRDNGPIRTLEELWDGYNIAPEGTTVRRAIGHLPPVEAGVAHPDDPLHVSPSFSNQLSLDRIRAIPHDGGSWIDLLHHPDADRLLIPAMKRTAERGDFGSHPDVYGRLWWDRPCVTIKRECAHVGNGRYAHPEQDRLCTVREMALMNGFPAGYKFNGRSLANKYRQIGDAVPPLISFQIAHLCHWVLTGKKPDLRDCILAGTSLLPDDIREAPKQAERVTQMSLFG